MSFCVLTVNSGPILAPAALNICACTLAPLLLSLKPLSSDQVTTKRPSASPVTRGRDWSLAVCVLTRNSPPIALPKAS